MKYTFQTDSAAEGLRIDACIRRFLPELPSRAAQEAFSHRDVKLDGKRIKPDVRVHAGQCVEVFCMEQTAPLLDVVYEDGDVIVVNKPSGLVVHPAPGHPDGTLVNALLYHCGGSLSGVGGALRPGIVHRLDMDTSGLMVAAKDDATQKALQDLIRMRVLDRRYITLVHGYVARDEDTIVTGIARSTRDRLRMAVSDAPGAREAITTYRTLERFEAGTRDEGYSLLECHLYTGRTHQIRVHMASIGHPLLGDEVYGPKKCPFDLQGQCLHAQVLGFVHPRTGEYVEFSSPYPAYFEELLTKLRNKYNS